MTALKQPIILPIALNVSSRWVFVMTQSFLAACDFQPDTISSARSL